MTVSERMSNAGLVPVVVLENAADAVPTARALLAGGVDGRTGIAYCLGVVLLSVLAGLISFKHTDILGKEGTS